MREQALIGPGRHFHRQPPATREGTWSLRLIGGGAALTVLAAGVIAVTGFRAEVGPLSLLGAAGLAGVLGVVAGGVLSIVAIARRGERSVYVLAPLPVWLFAAFLLVGELTTSH
jgi:hypothetical protein